MKSDEMKYGFCTIITFDYLHYALALNSSLLVYDPLIKMNVLIVDDIQNIQTLPDNISIYKVNEICIDGIGMKIFDKYSNKNINVLRWSLKPVFINFLLENGYEKVIYADWDLFFYDDYRFLFNELNHHNVLLSPHWRCSIPFDNGISPLEQLNFQYLFTQGLYNGGLIAVNRDGTEAMSWWANACEYICRKDASKGFFDDQTHLNLLPIIFEHIGIIRHKGFNIANWNQVDCRREMQENNEIRINGIWDVVCIHYTNSTICGILYGEDLLLRPYLDKYVAAIKSYKPDFDIKDRIRLLTEKMRQKQTLLLRIKGKLFSYKRLLRIL